MHPRSAPLYFHGVKKKPWKWTEEHQKAFNDVKATIAKDVSLAYPDYSKGFEIYTDGSKRQLGAVITQNNRPIAFFSRKLSVCQQKYSVTEIELLAIVETLKEFKGMLWGQPIVVYTDHKNLMQDALGLTCDRVYRWRLLLEEYGPEIVYIKGIHNTVADAISRLDFGPTKDVKENWMTFTKCWLNSSTTSALRDPAANKIHANRVSFECKPPRSSYKTLFLGTSLGAALSSMSAEKMAPIGLKNQECGAEEVAKAPIRYVPDRDPVQEALDLKPETLKCTLANGSETQVTVWSGHGTNEQFVLHVNKAYSTAKKMGLIPPAMMPKRHMT
eukprot:CCRYP_017057-RA/>CCRYP_017057-RA protein AED:0.40 eAED:0.43 QI:0/0/0/0.66/0.5/0.33/3/0/329